LKQEKIRKEKNALKNSIAGKKIRALEKKDKVKGVKLKKQETKIKEQEAKTKEQEAKTKEQEAKTKEQEAKIKEQEIKIKEQEAKIKENELKINQIDKFIKENLQNKASGIILEYYKQNPFLNKIFESSDGINYQSNTLKIRDAILSGIENDNSPKIKNKLINLKYNLNHFLNQMKKIHNKVLPNLSALFDSDDLNPELVMIALSRPSIRVVYEEVESLSPNNINIPIDKEELKKLASSGDLANVLALIGDAVLDLVIPLILCENKTENPSVKELSEERAKYVSNKNLATICDKWDLYNNRIKHPNPPADKKEKDTIHTKGTLVEAIYGLVYYKLGLDVIRKNLLIFQENFDTELLTKKNNID